MQRGKWPRSPGPAGGLPKPCIQLNGSFPLGTTTTGWGLLLSGEPAGAGSGPTSQRGVQVHCCEHCLRCKSRPVRGRTGGPVEPAGRPSCCLSQGATCSPGERLRGRAGCPASEASRPLPGDSPVSTGSGRAWRCCSRRSRRPPASGGSGGPPRRAWKTSSSCGKALAASLRGEAAVRHSGLSPRTPGRRARW